MSAGPTPSSAALHGYSTTQSYTYCNIAAVALLLYETCISFDRECRHIWQRKPSAATWIFTCNRYFVIALYIVNVPSTFRVSDSSCPTLVRLSQVLDILPYIVWAFFSSLRTFAMCNRAWHISLLIFMLSLTPVWIYIYRDVHQYTANFPPPTYCVSVLRYSAELDRHLTVVARVCLIVSDILVLSVTWSKTYGIVRLAREHGLNKSLSVTKVLLRDGSTYFTVWTILNSLHIAGTYVWSIRYLTTFTEALTSILVSRFILNLREVATAPNPADENDPATDAYWDLLESWRVADRFPTAASVDVTSLLAPLGAPLDHSLGESYERELGAPGERTVRAADVSVAQAGSGGRDAKQFSGLIRTHRAGSWLRGQRAARHSSCGSPAGQTL